jgi:hypothetical protein
MKIFPISPDGTWGLPTILYNGYRVLLPEVKRQDRGSDYPTPSGAEVKERVELCLYSTLRLHGLV